VTAYIVGGRRGQRTVDGQRGQLQRLTTPAASTCRRSAKCVANVHCRMAVPTIGGAPPTCLTASMLSARHSGAMTSDPRPFGRLSNLCLFVCVCVCSEKDVQNDISSLSTSWYVFNVMTSHKKSHREPCEKTRSALGIHHFRKHTRKCPRDRTANLQTCDKRLIETLCYRLSSTQSFSVPWTSLST
jgi:hypothetical protein